MARLRSTETQHLKWREVPINRYQRTTRFPSIYGPPARCPTENHGVRLVPQPTVSPEDPLNWSWWKKHAVLAALIPGCLLSDWTLTWGTTVFELQAPEWFVHMTVPAVAQSVSPGIFMQGPGGLLAVPLCQRYGRLPVLFWSQLLSLIVTIGATFAPGYASFTAMRTLQGFFGAAPQVIGLSIIHDMFFFHERTRKINIWAASFLIGPYLGPFISSLLLLKLDWRSDFGILAGFYGFSVLMVVIFGDETLFDRNGIDKLPVGHRQPFQRRQPFSMARHLTHLLVGVPARRRSAKVPTLLTVLKHQCSLLTRPYLLIPTALFVTPVTMWTIGMVSTISMFVLPPSPMGYGFSYVALSMLYFAPMIGTMVAEAWGHWFNDVLARRYRQPEGRLAAVYPAAVIGAAGLVVFGQTLENHLSWVGLAFGWAMLCFCTLACMTAISAYLLDCFPAHAALASAWINCWRVVGGFAVVYFQMEWVHRSGPGTAFGYQGVIIAATTVTVLVTQVWGSCWREKYPPPVAGY
ncbi:MFS general substrate transporter [Coniochaeta sp. PMI_546]|nr:MFS general substrate transporter [Coniochaeta sp. PMI_546]